MNVSVGQNETQEKSSGTYNALYIGAILSHGTNNTSILVSDFDPSTINVDVSIKRASGQTEKIMHDNFQLLGTFNTIDKGYHEFLNGIEKIPKGASQKEVKVRFAELSFGGHVRVNPGDKLMAKLTLAAAGVFSSNLNAANSSIEFDLVPSIGYQYAMPETIIEPIKASQSSDSYAVGDNVTRLMVMNFDQTDCVQEVITALNLTTDKIDRTLSFNQLQSLNVQNLSSASTERYGTSLPLSPTSPTVVRGVSYLPQTYLLHDVEKYKADLSKATLSISFNKAYVNASQNYVAYRKYSTDAKMLRTAVDRANKHKTEKMADIVAAK